MKISAEAWRRFCSASCLPRSAAADRGLYDPFRIESLAIVLKFNPNARRGAAGITNKVPRGFLPAARRCAGGSMPCSMALRSIWLSMS